MDKLEQALGYCFKDRKFLTQALTHSSFTSDIHLNYERLEFLGDRILGVTIAEMLCDTFRDEKEGDLAQRFVRLVCKETVAEVVRQLNIEKYIRAIGQGVCQQDNVLCDIGEALIAAIYLDSGDLNCARQFIFKHWQSLIDKKSQPLKDYKTFLQEQAAILKLPQPSYQLVEKNGPEHAPTFVVCLSLGEKIKTLAKGHSKKQAEQNAAEDILRKLNIHV